MVNKLNLFKFLFTRKGLVIFILLIQLVIIMLVVAEVGRTFTFFNNFLNLLSIFVCIHVLNKHEKPQYKLTWIFLILLFPFFGGILYIYFNTLSTQKLLKRALNRNIEDSKDAFFQHGDRLEEFNKTFPEYRIFAEYLQNYNGFPVYANTRQMYLNSGEAYHKQVLEELEKAEHYIFLEFFILKEGYMLNSIIDILEKKAALGLDVRIIYDDLGCIFTLPNNYPQKLRQKGIKCFVFNPFRPIVSSLQNNRDHRKIIIIDGKVAFTGGLNLADEYINMVERFGHWKDSAIMIEGDGAWSLTLVFLQMWNLSMKEKDDYMAFFPKEKTERPYNKSCGYVQPYADSPVDHEFVGEKVYLKIINMAKEYIYINTPYLIVDDNILSALTLAAKSGVDVRIITPHRWDKWIVAITSRSYYRRLVQAGVKVYEYTKGFNHGKSFVSDDKIATVGTTNLDFRSLYLHFECGVVVYSSETINALKEDFLKTIPVSKEITLKDCAKNAVQRIIPDALRIFAPLM